MLSRYSNFRTFSDNAKLGALTSFSAGMVNVISVIVLFAFTGNITGHFAILAQEIAKGNWHQAAVTLLWISLFFFGNFIASLSIIHAKKKTRRFFAHAAPVLLEIVCLIATGVYLSHYYSDSLLETEILVGIMLFAMGLQNGLTASISNFAVKTTHLTGLTTDLGILLSMLTKKEFRNDNVLVQRVQLLFLIMIAYILGGVLAGLLHYFIQYNVFHVVAVVLGVVVLYDAYQLGAAKLLMLRRPVIRKYFGVEQITKGNG